MREVVAGRTHDVLSGACKQYTGVKLLRLGEGGGLTPRSPPCWHTGRPSSEGKGRRCHKFLEEQKGFAEGMVFDTSQSSGVEMQGSHSREEGTV